MAQNTTLTDPTLEQALIALVFADNVLMSQLNGLQPDDITDPVMSAALAGALDMWEEDRPINLVTLKARLEGIRIDDGITALDVVRRLSIGGSMPPFADIGLRLKSLATKRRVSEYLRNVASAIDDESQPMPALIVDAITQLNDRLADTISEAKTSFNLYDASREFIEWLQGDDDPIEIPTGLKDLDTATGGWHRGQFIILAARPSTGKSAIALSSAIRTAMKGYGVLFFSLEMIRDQLVARALTDFAYSSQNAISYSSLKPKITDYERRRLEDASERFKSIPIEIETKNGLTVADIMARVRKSAETFKAKGNPLALVVIDHLLKIRPSRRYAGQPVKELDEISEAMCVMAKQMNVAVLGLHQLNRGNEARDNPRAIMSDLRGTGTLEQDADVILFPYRPAYPIERLMQEKPEEKEACEIQLKILQNKLEIQIAKQRQGPTSTLEFFVDMKANVVRDKEWRYK